MFALDLFNTRYEKELKEGAIDNTVARLIEPLSKRAADIRTQLRNGSLGPAEIKALEREYEDLVAKRLDIIHGQAPQDEGMGYGSLGETGPRPEEVPAYLRKQQGRAPLTPDQVKAPAPDTISHPDVLRKNRGNPNINENSDVLAGLTDILKIAASRQTPQNPRYFAQQVKDVALQLKDNPATQKWSSYLDGVVRWADVISSGKEQYSSGFANEVHNVLGPATRAYQDALLNKQGMAEENNPYGDYKQSPRAFGAGNFQRIVRANMGNLPTVTLEFAKPEDNILLDKKGIDLISDYYDGLENDSLKNHFIYRVLPSADEVLTVLKRLGWHAAEQPELPGIPTQGELPLQEKKKFNNDSDVKGGDITAGDTKVARELQKLRAQYPAARSDVEAVAKSEIDSNERSQQQLSAIKGANTEQDRLLQQLVALDKKQGKEIGSLDSENDRLEQQLAHVEKTNANLAQAISQMGGSTQSAEPEALDKPKVRNEPRTIDLIPNAPADRQPRATDKKEPNPPTKKSDAMNQMAQSLTRKVQGIDQGPAPSIRGDSDVTDINQYRANVVKKAQDTIKQKDFNPLATQLVNKGVLKPTGTDDAINENQRLHRGDPVVVTAPNEFEGKTGEIYDFSPSGTFVIVDLYNHGKHSMHLSDVEYNDYADQEETDDWYDEEMDEGILSFLPTKNPAVKKTFEPADPMVAKMLAHRTQPQPKTSVPKAKVYHGYDEYNRAKAVGDVKEEFEPSPVASAVTRRIMMQHPELLKQYGPNLVNAAVDNVADYVGDVDEIGSSDVSAWVAQVKRMLKENPPEAFSEGFQDFNKVEPYAVCLAGKPVKQFDYYEDARRFHDNWKKKLYREGDKAKADKITLMPLNLDEASSPAQQAAIAIAMKRAGKKPKTEAKADATGSWIVYGGNKVVKFKTHTGAKAYAAKNGGKVASSEFYADKIQKLGVAETALNPRDPAGDYAAKRKALQDLGMNKAVDQQAVLQRRLDLDREAKAKGVAEAGMPQSVVKNKQRYAAMSDSDFAKAHKDKSDDELKAMAWRHGYGKGSSHYVNKRNKGQQGVTEGRPEDLPGIDYVRPGEIKRKVSSGDHNPYPYSREEDDDYFREIFRKKREAAAKAQGGALKEFAPGQGGGAGDYFQALASAWYNGTFNTGSLGKGIKSQQDVERLLQRGVLCPDGVTRKFGIDYNSDFDGVVISSDDYYEHADYNDQGQEVDSRTGQKWGPYDYMEFGDSELDEGVVDALKSSWEKVKNFDSPARSASNTQRYQDLRKQQELKRKQIKNQVPVNELSTEKLAQYKKAAGADATAADRRGDFEHGNKRFKGIVRATIKQGDNDAKKHAEQGVAEGAIKDLRTELADKYRELAPKIERNRDSYLAGELYDALEEIAAQHGAIAEFRRMMNGARNRAHMDYDTNPGGFQNWFWYLPFEDELDEGLMKEPANRKEYLDQRDKLFRMMAVDSNPANKQIIKQALQDLEARYGKIKDPVKEESTTSSNAVERAILNRIMVAHTDLLMKFGPDKVMQAAEEVAYNVGDVDEIGTSDVSAYVNQVRQILGVEA